MAITKEMVLVRLDDMEPFAEARGLARLARGLCDRARHADHRVAVAELAGVAIAVAASVAEALRAGAPREELARWRQASTAIAELRELAYGAFACGAMSGADFDQIMEASARAMRECAKSERATRRRAVRVLDGVE